MKQDESRRSLFAELKRRHVYRVGAMYVAASFVLWQVADIVVSAFELPAAVMRAVVLAAVLGFPVALVLAWVYELTPVGIRRTRELDAEHMASAAGSSPGAPVADARPLHRRLATAALTVLVVLAGGWWAARERLFPAATDPAELTLAVFPFSVRGGSAVEYLREGAVDLLTRNFAGAANLTALDPAVVLRAAGTAGRLELEDAAGIARRIGAGQFVLGSVSQVGAQVRIDATLYALRDSVHALPPAVVQGDTARIFELIDQLTAALLAERSAGAATQRFTRTAAVTTESLPALKAYLEGEQQFRKGLHEEGVGAFRRAIELDSAFALARYRLAMSHHLRGEHDIALREIRGALRVGERLGSHDRRVMDAFHALHAGRVSEAERLLRELVAEHPRELEARLILAELLTSYNPMRGQPKTEARRHLETIIEADPQFACIYCQLAHVTMAEGDYAAAERWLRRAEGRRTGDTTGINLNDRMIVGLLTQDPAKIRESMAALDTLEGGTRHAAVEGWSSYALMAGDFDLYDELTALGAGPRAAERSAAHWLRLAESSGRGRWRAAAEVAARMAASGDSPEFLGWNVLIHAPFDAPLLLDAPLRTALHDRLAASRVDHEDAVDDDAADRAEAEATAGRRVAEIQFLLGVHASRAGDAVAARAWADSIAAAAPRVGHYRAGVENLARTVRADVLLRAGDARATIRELDAISIDVPMPMLHGHGYQGNYAAMIRAHAHAALGEHEHALRWLRNSATFASLPLAMRYGTWHRDMGFALEGLGRHDEARPHFARFAEAWSAADSDMASQVEAARRRLGER